MRNTELKFNLHIIEEELETYNPVSILHEPLELNIYRLRMFNPDIDKLCKHTIYIATPELIPSIKNNEGGLHIICPDRLPSGTPTDINFNLICLDGSIDEGELFSILQGIFEKYYRWQQEMIDLILTGGTVKNLTDLAGQMIQNPVTLFDAALKPVEETGQSFFNYEGTIWERILSDKDSIVKELSNSQKKSFFQNLNNKKSPFKFKYEDLTLLITNLYLDKGRIGSLVSADINVPFTKGQISLLINIKGVIEVFFQTKKKLLSNPTTDLIIEKMLRGQYLEEKLIRNHLDTRNFKMNDSYFIIVFDNAVKDFPSSYQTYCYNINNLFPKAITITFNEHLVTIVNTKSSSQTELLNNKNFINFLKESGIRCGISMHLDNFLNLKYSYRQATSAIREGRKRASNKYYFLYNDYFVEDLVHSLEKDTNIRSFCHPQVLILMDHDNETGSEYVKTLYNFLLHGRNITNTADSLFIHRNTLNYRLSKIKELTDFNLDDNFQLYHIITSCQLVEFM